MRILVVDDNTDSLKSLSMVLEDQGHQPVPVESASTALERIGREYFPLIITDIRMPGMDGLELLGELKQKEPASESDVVIVTGHGDMETAISALRKGAYDYLNKPINVRELAAVVRRSAEHQALLMENRDWRQRFETRVDEAAREIKQDLDDARDRLLQVAGIDGVVAESPAMRTLLEEARMYHNDPSVPVVIEGETGTGKEIIAKLIHYGDGKVNAPFVAINCSAIPANLFESELFGHDPGAFTGSARKGVRGKFELAENGAVFLDEVAEMPLSLQPKLLRVLEERTFYRVGGVKQREFKARVICAANQNLHDLVERGDFRRDLYHRLKVGHMVIPPLRQRPDDIPPLAELFLRREAHRKKKAFTSIQPSALEILKNRPWKGNVRELENTIERAVLTSDGEALLPEHLGFLASSTEGAFGGQTQYHHLESGMDCHPALSPESVTLPEDSLDLEKLTDGIILKALEKFGGNKTRTADYLGLSRFALHRRLQKKG